MFQTLVGLKLSSLELVLQSHQLLDEANGYVHCLARYQLPSVHGNMLNMLEL